LSVFSTSMARSLSPACKVPVLWATLPFLIPEMMRGSPSWRFFGPII
jgi:hypothetical protein